MAVKTRVFAPATIRPLSKDEINRQIECLSTELAARADEEQPQESGNCDPRWISAGELVRRMRPFLVLN